MDKFCDGGVIVKSTVPCNSHDDVMGLVDEVVDRITAVRNFLRETDPSHPYVDEFADVLAIMAGRGRP